MALLTLSNIIRSFCRMSCLTSCMVTMLPTDATPPIEVEITISPLLISDPPVKFENIPKRPPSEQATMLHREAMLESRSLLVERNDDKTFDWMLRNEKTMSHGDEYLAWIEYMQSRYAKPIEMALEAQRLGSYASIPPKLDDDGELSILPINGSGVLGKLLLERVLYEMEIESPESVLSNLPVVMSILEDWCQGVDVPVLATSREFERLLESIANRSDCPNLAFALSGLRSPFQGLGSYAKNHPELWQIEFKMTPEWLEQLLDVKSDDAIVVEHCRIVLKKIFQKLCDWGDAEFEPFSNVDQWMRALEKAAFENRRYLLARGLEFSESTAYERIAIAAGITRFQEHAEWKAELNQLPIHVALEKYNENQKPKEHSVALEGNGLGHVGVGLTGWSPRPSDYWYSQQTIQAMAFLSFVRHHFAIHGEFPESVNSLNVDSASLDPLTNREWKYERVTLNEATLELQGVDGQVRKKYTLKR